VSVNDLDHPGRHSAERMEGKGPEARYPRCVRPAVEAVLFALAASVDVGAPISIDAIGDALGTMAITTEEIEELFVALERNGHGIAASEGARGEQNLKKVVAAARAIREESGGKATVTQIGARAALSEEEVKFALALLRVMQR
jgi:hypothetical protein